MVKQNDADPGGRHLIIPLFIPHMGCPHQCIFCNQRSITGQVKKAPSPKQICLEVERFLKYGKKRYSTTQISFFGGSFLGLGRNTILSLLDTVTTFVRRGDVDSLRFSTRPDTVCPETLDLLDGFPVSTVELGVQSMNDQVLEASGRGHTAADTIKAAGLLKDRGYQIGLQMMVGLPEDSDNGAMATAHRIAVLQPDFVRIYPTLVLKGSPLAQLFNVDQYRPMSLEAGITLVKRLYLFFTGEHIPVVRMGLQASDGLTDNGDLLAGPFHPAFGHLIHGEIVIDAIQSALLKMETISDPLVITAHPTIVSRVQGLNKKNLLLIKKRFHLKKISIIQDETLEQRHLMVGKQNVFTP